MNAMSILDHACVSSAHAGPLTACTLDIPLQSSSAHYPPVMKIPVLPSSSILKDYPCSQSSLTPWFMWFTRPGKFLLFSLLETRSICQGQIKPHTFHNALHICRPKISSRPFEFLHCFPFFCIYLLSCLVLHFPT